MSYNSQQAEVAVAVISHIQSVRRQEVSSSIQRMEKIIFYTEELVIGQSPM
jgi:hypothetical protein